jgi:hypothetical protein
LNVVKSETALEVCLLDNSAEPMSHLVTNLDARPSCMPNIIPELDVLCIHADESEKETSDVSDLL